MHLMRALLPDRSVAVGRVADGAFVPLIVEDPRGYADALIAALESGADLSRLRAARDDQPLADVRALAPVRSPRKVVAIGLNYREHALETNSPIPAAPLLFAKFPSAVCGPDDPIRVRSADTATVDWEAELGVVIGRRCRDASEGDALDHVLGYCNLDDISARDAQLGDGQWVRGKSFDGFCPIGPVIAGTDDIPDPQRLAIACRVNGQTMQSSTTADMIFSVAEIIAYVSRFITLECGDVIATGTPPGVGMSRQPPAWLCDGDVVEVEIEGLGVLRNPVVVT